MSARLDAFLDENRVTRAEIAGHLGLDPSGISRKVLGGRPWKLHEIQSLLAFLTERLGRKVTYDELFGEPDPVAAGPSEAGV